MNPKTADLYDKYGADCHSCEIQFRQFGGRTRFTGPIRTVQCRDDNVLVRRTLEKQSAGEVLVVDGGGSLGSALMGDVIGDLAVKSGWSGVVILGVVRDTEALAKLDLGIKALGSNPKKSLKIGTGLCDGDVTFGGVTFKAGHWLYSDEDGILVCDRRLE